MRNKIYIATKTAATTPDEFWRQLETSLHLLRTDYLDLYQFHCVNQCYRPEDGTGMYECMLKAKEQGMIRHIGVTAHKIGIAEECVASGLYETMQFPFSYLSSVQELQLVEACSRLKHGIYCHERTCWRSDPQLQSCHGLYDTNLITFCQSGESRKISELEEWLSYMEHTPSMDEENLCLYRKKKNWTDR